MQDIVEYGLANPEIVGYDIHNKKRGRSGRGMCMPDLR